MENNSTLEKVLLVCNRNAELLQVVGATFDSKVASLRRIRKKNLIILKSFQKKSSPLIVLFDGRCWHLSCQISIGSVRNIVICSLTNISQYYNNLYFYCEIFNWNFIWNIELNNGVYCNLRNKSACLNTELHVYQSYGIASIPCQYQGILSNTGVNCRHYLFINCKSVNRLAVHDEYIRQSEPIIFNITCYGCKFFNCICSWMSYTKTNINSQLDYLT